MSTISILNDDWEIAFEDETVGSNAIAGLKMVRRTSGASATRYTTNELYSAVADAADDFQAMGFENPMLPVTPNAYTMENNYFIPRRDTEYLYEGAIDGDWTVTAGAGVYRKPYTVVTNFVDGDIGRQVTETTSGDTGTLLDFEQEPDGQWIAWIRPDTSGDTFALSTTISVTSDGGTGSNTGSGAATSGLTRYAAIQVIGSVPAVTEVYLYQNRFKMTDYLGQFQWWTTDSTVSLGIISVLVRIRNAGTLLADGDLEVFARRYTSLYDNFRLNVAAGGFSALPLASSPDINNTTGYRTAQCSSGVSDFDVGNYIYVGANWASATKKGVITAVNGTVTDPDIDYYLIGDLTDFVGTDSIQEYDPITEADGDGSATVDSVGAASGGPTDSSSGEGGTVTVSIGGFYVDHDGDSNNEPYSIQIDAQNNVPIAKVYERIKYITRRGADEADLFGAGVNIPGESYRGLDGIFEYDATSSAPLTEGDDITVSATGWTARLLHDNVTPTAAAATYIAVTDQQTSLDSISNDNVVEDESAETVTVHSAGTIGFQTFTSPKQSPFGTFTGSEIFGARGVHFANPASTDTQAYTLTDDLGNLRTPPNTVAFTVSNLILGDRVLVARDTGTAGVINKDQFGGLDTPGGSYNQLGNSLVQVAGSIDTEVPSSGWIRIVETSLQEEHKYYYNSRTTGSNGQFTLRDIAIDGAGVTSNSSTQLIDTGSGTDFTASGNEVLIGMLVRNTQSGKDDHVWEVTAVTDANTLEVRPLYGPLDATQDWDIGDTYTINDLIGDHTVPTDYASTDNIFDLILDQEVTTGSGSPVSVSNTFVKTVSSDFDVVVNARQGGVIIPFTQNTTVNDSGGSVTVVRTPDTIAT